MTVREELGLITKRNGGLLRAPDVVEFASNPKTALHSRFNWDDTEAAHQYRLWQAREIIAVEVVVLPGTGKSYRAYVSLQEDRQEDGGGYRSLVSVMSKSETRNRLLAQALADFDRWHKKYEALRELAPLFAARKRIELVAKPKSERVSAAAG